MDGASGGRGAVRLAGEHLYTKNDAYPKGVFRLMLKGALALFDAWGRRRACCALAQLGEAGLKDIGVSGGSIERAVSYGRE